MTTSQDKFNCVLQSFNWETLCRTDVAVSRRFKEQLTGRDIVGDGTQDIKNEPKERHCNGVNGK